MWAELLAVTSPTRRELAVAFVALLLLGAAIFGPQVADGGFYWDDWQNAVNVHVAGDQGLFSSLGSSPMSARKPSSTVAISSSAAPARSLRASCPA